MRRILARMPRRDLRIRPWLPKFAYDVRVEHEVHPNNTRFASSGGMRGGFPVGCAAYRIIPGENPPHGGSAIAFCFPMLASCTRCFPLLEPAQQPLGFALR